MVVYHTFHLTAVFVPLILLPLIFFCMGVSWFLSAIGVFLRDVAQLVNVLTTVLLFLAPILYPLSALPEPFRPFLYINPLTFIIIQSRAVLMSGNPPAWSILAIAYCISLGVAWFGYACFQKARKGFADIL